MWLMSFKRDIKILFILKYMFELGLVNKEIDIGDLHHHMVHIAQYKRYGTYF